MPVTWRLPRARHGAATTAATPRERALSAALILLLVFVGFLFWAFHNNQINGCIRGAADRHDNASGWRTAQRARGATAAKTMAATPGSIRRKRLAAFDDLEAEANYDRIADSLDSRTRPTRRQRSAFCHHQYAIFG